MFATKIIEQSSHLAGEASHTADQALQSTRHALDRALQGANSVASGASRNLRHGIRDEPLAAVLIALGAGAALATLVGALAFWRSRRD
jgi:hypothetical protein